MDSFDGTKLDTTKWSLRGLGSRRIGYNDSSMVKMENGNLLLMYDIKGDSILGARLVRKVSLKLPTVILSAVLSCRNQ